MSRDIYSLIRLERIRQVEKWGNEELLLEKSTSIENYNNIKYRVLGEEVGEVARAINDHEGDERIIEELVQVAAVCVAWASLLERKK